MNILVVDMIEGFTRIGALASPRVEALIPKQVAFLEAIPQDSNVIFACDCHGPNDSEFKRMPKHCEKGTEEAKICPELLDVVMRRNITFTIIAKTTHSAFFNTTIEKYPAFTEAGDDWVMFGCVTDICIAANLMELDYRGKNTTIVRDLVDTYEITADQAMSPAQVHDPEVYNELFFNYYLPGVWGAKIKSSSEVLNELTQVTS